MFLWLLFLNICIVFLRVLACTDRRGPKEFKKQLFNDLLLLIFFKLDKTRFPVTFLRHHFSLLVCEAPQRSLGDGGGGFGLGGGPGPGCGLRGFGLFDCRSRRRLGGSGGEAAGPGADLQHCRHSERSSDADEAVTTLRGGTLPWTVGLDLVCDSGAGSLPLL